MYKFLVISIELFFLIPFAIGVEPILIPVDLVNETKNVVVECGDSAKCEYIRADFYDTVNTLDQDGIEDTEDVYMTPFTVNGLYKFSVNHAISVPGLTGSYHNGTGTPGQLMKSCIYRIGYTLYIPEDGSDFERQYSYLHYETTEGSEPCVHYEKEDEP